MPKTDEMIERAARFVNTIPRGETLSWAESWTPEDMERVRARAKELQADA